MTGFTAIPALGGGVSRVLAWFSCGSASAVAAKLAVEKYGDRCEVVYCDTLAYEHPDNRRFMADVERWLGVPITILRSDTYTDIFDVFRRTRWLVGPNGARCTTELKKNVRTAYQRPDDLHVFGLTVDEFDRSVRFRRNNHDVALELPLIDALITKAECHRRIAAAGIEMPAMYRLGYDNNNCIGCVKGGTAYWNKIRRDFPEAFDRMAKVERELNAAICKREYVADGKRIRERVFLDELPPDADDGQGTLDMECGVTCPSEAA
jgi:3'-phosphoadenosine 5'-phosphosulfate sulfotransferase (PAPS reductase)/FAD synthetase